MKKSIYLSMAMAGALLLSACQADMDTPALENPVAPIKANTTILELKNAFENQTVEVGAKADGSHYVIHGRVVSSDASGNIYKQLVIQDETAALAFSINQGSLYTEYRLGQEMVVDLTGLYIGYYSGLQQVGWPTEPYNGQDQLGFMAFDYWKANAYYNGLPDPKYANVTLGSAYPTDEYYCITFSDFDELNNGTLPELQSQLVEFKNVHFQINEGEETYAPYQESVNRTLVDSNGQTLIVRNSGYSNFYNQEIPEGRGNVRGILSYYGSEWQLLLRDVTDVMITTKGEETDPFTIDDILSGQYAGMNGWTKGYVVGSVKAGVSTVTSADDVIFGVNAEMDNNVLIAAKADETDYTKCAVVQLPQSTMLRFYVNLLDNPDVYKAELSVLGTLGNYLGMPGVVGSNGGKNDFLINGKSVSDGSEPPAPAGDGTEANPYNVSYVMQSTADQTDVWVIGYVAGYVTQGDFTEQTAEFSANEVAGSTYYLNQNNIILSAVAPYKCGMANSIACQLAAASRPTLGLKDHPEVFGKQVKIKCRITDYLGVRGVRNITEVVVIQ